MRCYHAAIQHHISIITIQTITNHSVSGGVAILVANGPQCHFVDHIAFCQDFRVRIPVCAPCVRVSYLLSFLAGTLGLPETTIP